MLRLSCWALTNILLSADSRNVYKITSLKTNMLENIFSLASYGYFQSGAIGNMLAVWEQAGFFSYAIPFLLLFSIVFGLLTQLKMFRDNKTINAIISLAIGLMALQFDFVPRFFSEIFPRVGIGLVILLLVLIFTGLFADPKSKAMMYSMYGVGVVIIIVILVQTAGIIGWYSFLPWLGYNWPIALAVVAFFAMIGIVIASSRERREGAPESVLAKLLTRAAED